MIDQARRRTMSADDLIDPIAKKFRDRVEQDKDERESRHGRKELEQQLEERARQMAPAELRTMEGLLWDRWQSVRDSLGELIPEFHYNGVAHSLESDQCLYAVTMDISEGWPFTVDIRAGLHRNAQQRTARLPDVRPKRWRLRASYDGIEFRWINGDRRRLAAGTVVEELLEALIDFLPASFH
jgi:hypothetical protein